MGVFLGKLGGYAGMNTAPAPVYSAPGDSGSSTMPRGECRIAEIPVACAATRCTGPPSASPSARKCRPSSSPRGERTVSVSSRQPEAGSARPDDARPPTG